MATKRKRITTVRMIAATIAVVVVAGVAVAIVSLRDGGVSGSSPAASPERTSAAFDLPPIKRLPVAPPLSPPALIEIDGVRWPAISPAKTEAFERARGDLRAARAAYTAGRVIEGDRRMLTALDRLSKAGIRAPELRSFHYESLVSTLDSGNYPAIEKRALFWLRNHPNDPFALRLVMIASNALRNRDRAVKVAEKLLELRPNDVDAYEVLAIASFALRRWESAVAAAENLRARRPQDAQAWRILCQAASELGAKDKGIDASRRLLALVGYPSEELWKRKDAEKVVMTAISVLHRFKAYDDVRDVAAFYRRRHPDDTTATMAEGVARLETGDAKGAEPLLRAALADPTNAQEVKQSLGVALSKQRRFDEAARCFAELLLENPFLDRAYYQYGLCLARLGKSDSAKVFLARSEALGQSGRDIRRYRQYRGGGRLDHAVRSSAKGYRARGQYAEAEKALREPGVDHLPVAVITRIEFYLECFRVADARGELARLAKLVEPSSTDLAGNRARVLWASGKRDEALELFRGLTARSDCPSLWTHEYAERLLESDRAAEAAALIEPLRVDASHRVESWLLGRARFALGGYAEALALFESISQADLRWDEWLGTVWIARARVAAGKPATEALELLDALPLAQRRTRLAKQARAEALRREAHPWDAVSVEIDAHRARVRRASWPRDGALWLGFAEALERGGERLDAIKFARVALHAFESESRPAPRAHEVLAEWLDDPGEAFLRLRHQRALAAIRPADAELAERVKRLESELIP